MQGAVGKTYHLVCGKYVNITQYMYVLVAV